MKRENVLFNTTVCDINMTLPPGDHATIINCFIEKKWRGREICRQFKSKNWSRETVDSIIRRYEERNNLLRKKGSGRPATVTRGDKTTELLVLTESQESQPGTSKSLRSASKLVGMSSSSASHVSKKSKRKSVKRIITPQLTDGAVSRRFQRSRNLYTRYTNDQVKLLVWQDEKDLPLQVPSNRQNNRIFIRGRKNDVNPARLYHPINKMSQKLMVSCLLSWNGISKPFFVDPAKTKVNAKYFRKHLEKDLIPALHRLYPNGDGIYVQDGASAHTSNLVQHYLKDEFGLHGFVNKSQWPPKSPDLNPLDYWFWNALKEKVYEGRRTPFTSVDQLKRRVRRVWQSAINEDHLQKSILEFKKRLNAVVQNEGGPIVHKFS